MSVCALAIVRERERNRERREGGREGGRDMDKTEKGKETRRSSDQETLSPGESVDLFGNALDFAESLSCGSSQFTRH